MVTFTISIAGLACVCLVIFVICCLFGGYVGYKIAETRLSEMNYHLKNEKTIFVGVAFYLWFQHYKKRMETFKTELCQQTNLTIDEIERVATVFEKMIPNDLK